MTVRLSELGEDARSERFAALQERLPAVWDAIGRNLPGESIVVLPSVAPDPSEEGGAWVQALEERMLFLLLLLRQPRLRVIYVTGRPVPEAIVEYYLALMPGVIPSQARRRLRMVATGDGSRRALAQKVVERPRVVEQLRELIPDPARCHLVPYASTELERDVALSLGVPLYGADPRLLGFGTKSGGRRVFADARVPHPLGREDVHSVEDVVAALRAMLEERPAMRSAIVKLDEGVAGRGNASVDLRDLPAEGRPDALRERVAAMALEDPRVPMARYLDALSHDGGVVEERVAGREVRSPSVQLRVTPLGEVELLSTHDQLLGGPGGQSFLGCRFPADPAYAPRITAEAAKVGAHLAREGVLGRFAVDFVVVRDATDDWHPYAIELNLRKGGTTHPFLTLQFLTDGRYDPPTATFSEPSGRAKHLVATDHLEADALRGLTVDDLFELAAQAGLHYHHAKQTGVAFHMMSALSELGRLGLTAVGDSAAQADELFRRAEQVLLEGAAPAPEPALPAL